MRRYVGLATAGLLLMDGGAAWAARPLAIDDADLVDLRQMQVEAGLGYVHGADRNHWDFPLGLTYGLLPRLQVFLGFGGQLEERTENLDATGSGEKRREGGIGDLVVAAKGRIVDESVWLPRQATAVAVKFPTADQRKGLGSGKTDIDLTWMASKSLGERSGVHFDLGYTWIGRSDDEDAGDIVHYGLALDYLIIQPLQWVGEVLAEKELRRGADTMTRFNTGLRWNAGESVTVDLALGSKISGAAPDFTVTAGLTWISGSSRKTDN